MRLYTAYGQRQVSTIYAPNDEYWVVMELEDKYQRDPDCPLACSTFAPAPVLWCRLNAVANLATSLGPLSVNHLGQLPAVTISFNLRPGVAIGDAVNEINAIERDLPQSISTQFQGTAQAFQSSLTGLGLLLLMAILVIYIVLGILYESFIHPLTILSGLPSAAFGALLTLQIFGYSLDLYAFVGVIMLIGIVKKNAIMMVDFAVETRAPRQQDRAGGGLRGLPHSFPADHDDHHGRSHGHGSHRFRHRRGSEFPPPAGSGGCGWPALLAARHSVSHARLLHLHGFLPALAGSPLWHW